MRFGLALLRIVVGSLFMGHGLQKVKGWFGGPGLDSFGESLESMGLRPGRQHAAAAGMAETVGGGLLCAAFALAAEGPGALSLDEGLGLRLRGLPAAIAELAGALAAAAIIVKRPQLVEKAVAPASNNGFQAASDSVVAASAASAQ